MAVDMFVQIGKLKGESKDSVHKEKIDVLAWSFGMSNPANAHGGGGAGAGKVNVQDLSFTKYIDKTSTELMLAASSGKHFDDALLIVRKAGGDKAVEYLKIKMSTVFISSVSTGGSGGEDRLTENVTLHFAKFTVEYTPQKADGTADKTLSMGWDIAANIKH